MPGNQGPGGRPERGGSLGGRGSAKLSDNSNNRIQLTNNENLKNLQATQSNSGSALHSAMTTNAATSVRHSPAPPLLPLLHSIVPPDRLHISTFMWSSMGVVCVVDFLLKRCAIQFQILLNTFPRVAESRKEWHGTGQHGTAQDTARHGTAWHCTAEDSLGPHWDRQLTMLSRNFTRR